MSTFIDPVKIRRLAASGDPFWKGAAWILDQQDAARLGRIVDDVADRSEFRSVEEVRAHLNARRGNWDDDWSPTPTA